MYRYSENGLSTSETEVLQKDGHRNDVIRLPYALMFWKAAHTQTTAELLTYHDIAKTVFSPTYHGGRTFNELVRRRVREWLKDSAVTVRGKRLYEKDGLIQIFVEDGRPNINQVRAKQAEAFSSLCKALPFTNGTNLSLDRVKWAVVEAMRLSSADLHTLLLGLERHIDLCEEGKGNLMVRYPTNGLQKIADAIIKSNTSELEKCLFWELGVLPTTIEDKKAKPYAIAQQTGLRVEKKIEEPQIITLPATGDQNACNQEENEVKSRQIEKVARKSRRRVPRKITLIAAILFGCALTTGAGLAAYKANLLEAWERGGVSEAYRALADLSPKTTAEKLNQSFVLLRDNKYSQSRKILFNILGTEKTPRYIATSYYYLAMTHRYQANYPLSFALLEESEKHYKNAIDPTKNKDANNAWLGRHLQKVYKEKALVRLRQGRSDQALELARQSSNFAEAGGIENTTLPVEWEVHFSQGQFSQSLEIAQKMHPGSISLEIEKDIYTALSLTAINDPQGEELTLKAIFKANSIFDTEYLMLSYCNIIFKNKKLGIDSSDLIKEVRKFAKQNNNNELLSRLQLVSNFFKGN